MERKLSGDKDVVKRGAWCPKEDKVLADYIKTHGEGKWSHVAKKTGLNRSGKSCRLRWLNYLRPDVKRGNISPEEEDLIIRMHKLLGNRWSLIAGRLPGRTDNQIKNFWNINLSKRVPEARPCRIKINAKNDGADEGGNCTAKDDQVQVIQSKTLNCTKAAAMIPSHHHLHDGDQRVNIQDQRVVDDISSSSFLRDLDNFINDVLHESEINGDQNYVVDDQEGAYWMEDIDGHAIPLSDVNIFF